MRSYKQIKSVRTAVEILRFLSEQTELVSGGEVAKAVGIPQGTAMCHLTTLEGAEFVERAGNLYELGQFSALLWGRRKALLEAKIAKSAKDLHELGG